MSGYRSKYTGAEIDEKLEGSFGEIHLHDGVMAQSIPTGSTYTKLTGFVDNGESVNMTPDVANNKIIITKTGYYKIDSSFSFESGTGNVTFFCAPFKDDVEQDDIHWNRKVSVANDVGSASFCGIIQVTTVPCDIDVRIRHDNAGAIDFIPKYMNLNIIRVDV